VAKHKYELNYEFITTTISLNLHKNDFYLRVRGGGGGKEQKLFLRREVEMRKQFLKRLKRLELMKEINFLISFPDPQTERAQRFGIMLAECSPTVAECSWPIEICSWDDGGEINWIRLRNVGKQSKCFHRVVILESKRQSLRLSEVVFALIIDLLLIGSPTIGWKVYTNTFLIGVRVSDKKLLYWSTRQTKRSHNRSRNGHKTPRRNVGVEDCVIS
jgi:hypothetical protein